MVAYGRRNTVLNYNKKIKSEMIKTKSITCPELCVRGCHFDDPGSVINEDQKPSTCTIVYTLLPIEI